jgi:hypothetical protein
MRDKRLTSKRLRSSQNFQAALLWLQNWKQEKSTAQLSTFFSTDTPGTVARYFLVGFGYYFPPGK